MATTAPALPTAMEMLTRDPKFDDGTIVSTFTFEGPLQETSPFFTTRSKVIFSPAVLSGKYGRVTVRYNKMIWTALPAMTLSAAVFAGLTSKAQLLALISEHTSVQVTLSDIVNDAIVTESIEGLTSFRVQAHAQSLLWEGALVVSALAS